MNEELMPKLNHIDAPQTPVIQIFGDSPPIAGDISEGIWIQRCHQGNELLLADGLHLAAHVLTRSMNMFFVS